MHITVGDLIERGRSLKIGCSTCHPHLYIKPDLISLPKHTPVPDVCNSLKCPQCKTVNEELGYPIWTRLDARPPKMGAG